MKKINSQKGFAGFEVIVVVLLLVIVGFAGYTAYQAKHNSDTKTSKPLSSSQVSGKADTSADQANALAHVKEFYKAYLGGTAPLSEWVKDGFITQKAADAADNLQYDAFTCSQNALEFSQYTFSTPTISGGSGTIKLSGTYAGPPTSTTEINLGLVKNGQSWVVDSFSCPGL
jgi:Tfp pilus assembly protein PilV